MWYLRDISNIKYLLNNMRFKSIMSIFSKVWNKIFQKYCTETLERLEWIKFTTEEDMIKDIESIDEKDLIEIKSVVRIY